MTDVPPEVPLEDVAEDVLVDDAPDPEEYRATEREQTSETTGTLYAGTGEAEVTPQEEQPVEEDAE